MRARFAATAFFLGSCLLGACASDDGENGGEGTKSGASGAAGSGTGGANAGSGPTGGSGANGGIAGHEGGSGGGGNASGGDAGSGVGGNGGAGAKATGGAAGASGSTGASGASGSAGGGAFECGTQTCRAEQYCFVPCCGSGGPPLCTPKPDGGTCPPNTTDEGPCCREIPCTPSPPRCTDTVGGLCTITQRFCFERCG